MPLTVEQLQAMDRTSALVVTVDGEPISIGRIQLSEASPADAMPRLDLHFETEAMHCVLRVPIARVDELAASWDGAMYRYVLPKSDEIWRRRAKLSTPPPFATPLIETYPMPERPPAARNAGL